MSEDPLTGCIADLGASPGELSLHPGVVVQSLDVDSMRSMQRSGDCTPLEHRVLLTAFQSIAAEKTLIATKNLLKFLQQLLLFELRLPGSDTGSYSTYISNDIHGVALVTAGFSNKLKMALLLM